MCTFFVFWDDPFLKSHSLLYLTGRCKKHTMVKIYPCFNQSNSEEIHYSFFFNLFIFNWKIIVLQYCVGFCQTSTWISHRCTYVPLPLEPPSHFPPHPTPLSCNRGFLSHRANSHWWSILHMVMYITMLLYSLHTSHPPILPLPLLNCP